MTIAWSAWYDHVMPELPGCSIAMVDIELRRKAIEFCNDTAVYGLDLAAINTVANTAEYALVSPDADAECFLVLDAWFLGTRIERATQDELGENHARWQEDTTVNPKRYTQTRYDKVRLVPIPSTSITGALTIRAACRPLRTATGLADHIANQYFDAIAFGALGALLQKSQKPWSNPSDGAAYAARYANAKHAARIAVSRSLARDALMVSMQPAA